ncbi:MAG: VIT1/CCC1 transporter family protein [Candidatus Micrarchaeia archaeon]
MQDDKENEGRKRAYLVGLYKMERMHHIIFRDLAKREKNGELKSILEKLATTEGKHARMWAKILEISNIRIPKTTSKFFVFMILLIRHLLGLVLAVKAAESFETQLDRKIMEVEEHGELLPHEKAIIREIIKDELRNETPLKMKIVAYNQVLRNIRDIIIGMNDGLVEVLAAVSGLGAALHEPLLVLVGGVIIALSGTLSMTGSAFLSTSYEINVNAKGTAKRSAKASAFYVGVAYAIGAAVPLIPFALGAGGYYGIAISIILTATVLSVVASLVALVSSISIKRNIAKTLAISIGSAFITIALGAYARSVLHITI